MGFVEDLDKALTTFGFTKIIDATPENLQRDKTESCLETQSTAMCSSYRSGEIVVLDISSMVIGAVAIYVEWKTLADWLPREGSASCPFDIKVVGEGDNYEVVLSEFSWDPCSETRF